MRDTGSGHEVAIVAHLVDMRVVCPQDVKKMLLKQVRLVYWKKWAAKHECEELKEGVWLASKPCCEE